MDFVKSAGGGALWHLQDRQTGATLCGLTMVGRVDRQTHDTRSAICTCPACQRARAAAQQNSTPPADLAPTVETPIEVDLKTTALPTVIEPALGVSTGDSGGTSLMTENGENERALDESLSAGIHIDIEV